MKRLLAAVMAVTVCLALCTAEAVSIRGPFIYVEGNAIRVGYDEDNDHAGNSFVYQLLDEAGHVVLTERNVGNQWFPAWTQEGIYKARVYYTIADGSTQSEDSAWTVIAFSSGGSVSQAYQPEGWDMGVPRLQQAYGQNSMNMAVLWVQTQLKATGVYYQGEIWDVTGHLGIHTAQEITAFMASCGYPNYPGQVDQTVVDALAARLGSRLVPVYVGGFYERMASIMTGGSAGSMDYINSNLQDMVPRVTTGARWVQCCLKKLGYYQGPIDGKYGADTDKAVRSFQKDYGFQQRDYVSLGVARAMLEACWARGYSLEDLP
ncbi:MAG: peptidoglycan-binding protein [Aristaeellaceae bacterium]